MANRHGERLVPHQLLHGAKVSPAHHQAGRESVTVMQAEVLDAGSPEHGLEDAVIEGFGVERRLPVALRNM